MVDLLTYILVLPAALIAVPILVLFTQICASRLHSRKPLHCMTRPRVAVVIPAHDEAAMIHHTLASVRLQLRPGDRLLVVADNCTDDTARLAADNGAEVVERRDRTRLGKGYALDHGLRHLAGSELPDVIIFVDADCELAPHAIERIAALSASTARPVQARYVMWSPPQSGPIDRIAQFAWRVKNLLRPMGFYQLGLPCPLMGTAMAIPRSLTGLVDLATGHLAEDQKLGADLALAGHAPLFCPDAQVSSRFPVTRDAKDKQRTRWEHGHLSVISEYVPRLLAAAFRRRDASLLAFALDLSVPPLSLLVSLLALLGCLSLVWLVITAHAEPLIVLGVAALLFGGAIGIAWLKIGQDIIRVRDLIAITGYCALRLPSFVRFFGKRQIQWIRTERS